MFTHPLTFASLLAFGVSLVWVTLHPGMSSAAAAVLCAAVLIWACGSVARSRQRVLAEKLSHLEQRCDMQRTTLQRSESRRAAAEADLRSAEQRYLLAVRGSQDGLWEWDLRTNAMYLSPRWKSMLGFEAKELADDKGQWRARVHPDDRDALDLALAQHLSGLDPRFDHEMRLLHKDGSVRHVLSRGVAIRAEGGAPYRMVAMDTDVTRLRRMQAVLDAVAEGTTGVFGDRFFAMLVENFARALEVDRVFLTECADYPPTRVRMLAQWTSERGLTDNLEYALAGTPCEQVVGEMQICFHADRLAQKFPREAGYEAFLGLPIVASDGRVIGHLALMNRKPLRDDVLVDRVYRIFLARAASEMERLQALARSGVRSPSQL